MSCLVGHSVLLLGRPGPWYHWESVSNRIGIMIGIILTKSENRSRVWADYRWGTWAIIILLWISNMELLSQTCNSISSNVQITAIDTLSQYYLWYLSQSDGINSIMEILGSNIHNCSVQPSALYNYQPFNVFDSTCSLTNISLWGLKWHYLPRGIKSLKCCWH